MHSTRQQIVEKHQSISREISKDIIVNNSLIDQMHEKKFSKKRTKYHPRNEKAHGIYKKILFTNKSKISTFDTYPSDFKSKMDSKLFEELKENGYSTTTDDADVYYGKVQETLLDEKLYGLEDNTELTVKDKTIIKKYADNHLALLEKCVEICDNDETLEEEAARVRKIYASCDLLIK